MAYVFLVGYRLPSSKMNIFEASDFWSQIKKGFRSALEHCVRARTLGWFAEGLSIARFDAADQVTHQYLLKLAGVILVFVIEKGEIGQMFPQSTNELERSRTEGTKLSSRNEFRSCSNPGCIYMSTRS
jgi:hypothetical protein